MTIQNMNRKVHIIAGLTFFPLVLLFAVSGLMLNHRWSVWDYFPQRVEHTRAVQVQIPRGGSDLARARSIISQVGVQGEINYLLHNVKSDSLEIKTTRPGQWSSTRVHLESGAGRVTTTDLNAWSLLPALHVMSGLHSNLPDKKNWVWTEVWSLMMDLTVVALLILLASGFYMWVRLKTERRAGILCLEIGTVIFGIACWALCKF